MIEKECQFCSKRFQAHNYRKESANFCSVKCYNVYREIRAYQKICPRCGKKFINTRETRNQKYCGKECSRKYNYADKICPICQKSFKFSPKNHEQIFCSNQCSQKNRAYKIDETFFDCINSEGKAYFLGLMFSDGNISGKNNKINISSNDKDLIQTCKKLLKADNPIYHYKNSFLLTIGNYNLHKSLNNLGVLPRKSWKELSIPPIPKKMIRHFVRGFYDGDGCFFLDKRQNNKYIYLCASLSCRSYQFSQQIKEMLEKRLNISFHKLRFDSKGENKGSYQLCLSRKADVKKFTKYLYRNSNYYLKRKHNIVKKFYHGQI